MFQSVEYQFLPYGQYGSYFSDLKNDKINVIVASIEGFLSGMENSNEDDESILVNIINDDILDIERENRNPQQEENINHAVLKNFLWEDNTIFINGKYCNYYELKLSELKTFRNDKEKLTSYFKNMWN